MRYVLFVFMKMIKLAQRHVLIGLHATIAIPGFTQHVLKPARSTLSMCVIIVGISRQAIYGIEQASNCESQRS